MKIEGISRDGTVSAWEQVADYRRTQQEKQGGADPSLSADGTQQGAKGKRAEGAQECRTCEGRKYQDGSDDPGVSFKTPTNISPEAASAAVRGHEQQHVTRERGKAAREDREVVSQSVTYHTAICPECGKSYTSGGTTRTVTRGKQEQPEAETPAKRLDTYV